jgi:hypothetical protein
MVLSATRGLVLFRVIREGIGLTQRLSATGTVRLQAIRMLTLEPERLKNQLATTRKKITGDGGLFPETLKRLAISVCQRRSFLSRNYAAGASMIWNPKLAALRLR